MTGWQIAFSVVCVLWGWSLAWAMKRVGELLRAVEEARDERDNYRLLLRERDERIWNAASETPEADPEELVDLGEHFESLLNDPR